MTRMSRPQRSGLIMVALSVAAGTAKPVAAQTPITWENATELSFVSTGGNASSSTLGLKAALTGTKDANVFKFEVGGIRSETGTTTRTATGTAASHTINETTVSQVTAASYFAKGRYDREFGQMFAFTGAGWDRNTFAGIQNRYALVAGVGRTFVDGENGHFKADVGATYTIQKDVDPAPGADEGFAGARFSLDAKRKLSETADYLSALTVDENLENTEDMRADWTNSISVALSQKLALKTSVQLLYDHLPSLLSVPLVDGGGAPTGAMVSTPGDKLDRIFTLALVIKL
jgi:putative salt-induced outer membrane protein YdiY